MGKVCAALLAFFWACTAQAFGVSFAVESVEKARMVQKENPSRHILIFYTVPTN